MKKIRIIFSVAAVCLALAVSSFTTIKHRNTVTKHYKLNDDSGIMNAANYDPGPGTSCGTGSLPCTIEYDNSQTLQQYLDSELTPENVTADAVNWKG